MSELKIYKTNLTPERNAKVDDISYYLSTCTVGYNSEKIIEGVSTHNSFQHIKLAKDIKIKINSNQDHVPFILGNYAEIFQDHKNFYFFVLNSKWIAEETVELTLSIDSVNTFTSDFNFSPKTNIIRQHMPRYKSNNRFVENQDFDLQRVIDPKDEGINNALQVRYSKDKIFDITSQFRQNWYIVYKNPTENESQYSLSTFIIPESKIVIDPNHNNTVTIDPYDLTDTGLAFFPEASGENLSITWKDSFQNTHTKNDFFTSSNYFLVVIKKNRQFIGYKNDPSDGSVIYEKIDDFPLVYNFTINVCKNAYTYNNNTLDTSEIASTQLLREYNCGVGLTWYTHEIKDIDLTDSKNIMVICLPYCPINLRYNNGVLVLPTGWTIDDYKIKPTTYNVLTEYGRDLPEVQLSRILLDEIEATSEYDFKTSYAEIKHESKFYNSNFYTFKLIYDNFTNEIAFERWNTSTQPGLKIYFKPTNGLSSDLIFKWSPDTQSSYKHMGDYDDILVSNRNNQVTLLNSEYLNYVRTGYNYDKKSKNQAIASSGLSTGLSIIGALASFAASGVTGGASVAAGIGLASSAISGIANTINQAYTAENNIQQKLEQSKNQAVNVSGTNDINLLKYYSDNKLWINTYTITDRMKADIFDLFHYCGYAVNETGFPEFNSRLWWNYVQCDAVFTNEKNNKYYNEYLDDIKARYKAGVTIYHKVALVVDGVTQYKYDWSQQYENWETFLFEE